jgi:hypothetical protein
MPSFGLSDALSQTDVAVLRETECRRLLDALHALRLPQLYYIVVVHAGLL